MDDGAVYEPWVIFLLSLAGVCLLIVLLIWILNQWAAGAYQDLLKNPKTECDIDTFVGKAKNPVQSTKVVLMHKFRLGNRQASTESIPLETTDSPHVKNLRVSRRSGGGGGDGGGQNCKSLQQVLEESEKSTPIVIATIRMGFGHHRLAYSAASWALEMGHVTIFHDLLNIKSDEADLIKSTDELYSRFSRYASEMGGAVEKAWGGLMKSGDDNALRVAALTAAHLQPLLTAYPKSIPLICTHQLVALTAAAAGFTNVVNLVVDNYPQWFLVVPRTLNIVQGPVNYQSFLRMGVPANELRCVGHWCPHQLVTNLQEDCTRRADRARQQDASKKKPVRLLIPVGGAGAQRTFIIEFVRALSPLVKKSKVQLFLNAGDHAHMKQAFVQVLDECSLDFETVTTSDGVYAFQERLLKDKGEVEPNKSVTLFAFDEYFPAVATTDILSRVADVLCCKPSELAFYALPKLHIRRVGDHEADSARRAAELGDGTTEAREVPDAMRFVDLFLEAPSDLLVSMNDAILRNRTIGIYDGCKRAVEIALERHSAAAAK